MMKNAQHKHSQQDYATAHSTHARQKERGTGTNQTENSMDQRTQCNKKRRRNRSVLWYNPPFNKAVTTNIGRKFLGLVDKHFKKDRKDKLNKIINRHTVKISYSCTPNMQAIIKSHNTQTLNMHSAKKASNSQATKKCNCRKASEYPVQGECLSQAVIYKASNNYIKHCNNS